MTVLSLELNEVNFHFIEKYCNDGHLPTFTRLLNECQLTRTIAEDSYPILEPWIQWPTVYTGKTHEEHQIFRLGDSVLKDHVQIWEYLESNGLRVGAVSPMNAANRCKDPAFFLPDPWTNTKISATPRVAKLYELIARVVNDNASSDVSIIGLGSQIAPLAFPYLSAGAMPIFLRVLWAATRYKWAKAALLDLLLTELTLELSAQHTPDFVSLFLNAGAHIQHHHMYDSAVYDGSRKNPLWYSKAAATGVDPLLFIYDIYDQIVARVLAQGDMHVLLTTGLSQCPNERDHYQYRIVDFDGFARDLALGQVAVHPRMSRDFLLEFDSASAARLALPRLEAVQCGGKALFKIEDRGNTLFCQVSYFGPPKGLKQVDIGGVVSDHSAKFVLVSIENGIHHQTIGYHIDTRVVKGSGDEEVPLTAIFDRLSSAALTESSSTVREAA